jgi:tripartite-type tricarboxylate transporter receptor subunit TctC
VAEYVAYAKANPGKINRASVGAGSITNLCAIVLDRAAGITTTHVPYSGDTQMMLAMLSNQVDVYISSGTQAMSHIRSGAFRALAVFDRRRAQQLPDVPTMKESGFDVDALAWFGFVAPAGTPAETVARLNRSIGDILNSDSFAAKAQQIGWIRRSSTPEEFGRFIRAEYDQWGPLITELGLARSQ